MHRACLTFSLSYSSPRVLVNAISEYNRVNRVKRFHARIVISGFDQCSVVQAKLVRKLAQLGVPMETYGHPVFDRVMDPNPFLWAALIRGYALEGRVSVSAELYCRMSVGGARPLSFTFSTLFKACGGVGDVDLGRGLHGQMISVGGFVFDLHAGNSLIDMHVKCGRLECARKVFDGMPERDAISWTQLIVACGKIGDMEMAKALFEESLTKDCVTWTAMVSGYFHNARPRSVLDVFERMRDEGVEIVEVALVGSISACSLLEASKYVKWVQLVAETPGHGPCENVFVGSVMVDMYSSSMVAGLAMHGRAHAVIGLFRDVLKLGIRPNGITFVGLLTVCSHAGLVGQGQSLFAAMEKCYGVVLSVEHYSCLMDLLDRAGKLDEALHVIERMPVEPNGGAWGALLTACQRHRNPDIARLAADHLFDLEPDAIGNYTLLSNIYASAGMWDDVSRLRRLARERGIKKNPGYSWVEGKRGEFQQFVSGDLSHPMFDEIDEALGDLPHRLEALGYELNLSCVVYNVRDEDKRRVLRTHSEKLALAYKLVTSGSGSTTRIMKNLRMCKDCHVAMCAASCVTGREIIVRDVRFHHFRKVTCSRGNYG